MNLHRASLGRAGFVLADVDDKKVDSLATNRYLWRELASCREIKVNGFKASVGFAATADEDVA